MPLSDYLEGRGPTGDNQCKAARSADRLEEGDRAEFDEWVKRRRSGDVRFGLSMKKMGAAIGAATGIKCSEKTLGDHLDMVCCCYS